MQAVVAVGRVWLLIHKANAYHKLVSGAKEEWRFRSELAEDKNHKLTIQYSQGSFITEVKSLRMQPCINGIYFEKNWPDFLKGDIYTQ